MKTKILLMFGVLLLTATPVMGIPGPGDYEWAPGGPLAGTFTSNGSMLTTFSFTAPAVPGGAWTPTDNVLNNDISMLDVLDVPTGGTLRIVWELDPSEMRAAAAGITSLVFENDVPFNQSISTAPVPEPATLILLSTGLLGLVGYRWRQGRREGQQVG